LVTTETGTCKISVSQLQAVSGYTAILSDRLTGSKTVLSGKSGYSFTATPGTITGRFSLDLIPAEKKTIAASEEKKTEIIQETSLKIYSATGRVCILPQGSGWDGINANLRIFDITGRVVFMSDDERLYSGELKEFQVPGTGGLLIVEVVTGQKRYLEKIVLAK